jgi:hypothetical protein
MLCAMPATVRIDGLDELLDRQFSVASRGQLLALGMRDNAMQWRVRAGGPWQTLLPGVYLGLTGMPNLPQQEMAALLYAGPGSLITGPVALMHHGLPMDAAAYRFFQVRCRIHWFPDLNPSGAAPQAVRKAGARWGWRARARARGELSPRRGIGPFPRRLAGGPRSGSGARGSA